MKEGVISKEYSYIHWQKFAKPSIKRNQHQERYFNMSNELKAQSYKSLVKH